MRFHRKNPASAIILLLAIPARIAAVFALPNAFGDAYTYLQQIEDMRAKLGSGTFAFKDLFGFWLPLYQFICALGSAFIGHVFYFSKFLSALCGIGICVVVAALCRQINANQVLAIFCLFVIAFNPMHVLYAASALTDIPHAALVLGSLYFVSQRRWMWAAVLATGAGLIRIESWMLIGLLPALQFYKERKITVVSTALPLLAPILWLLICYQATGNWLTYFVERQHYIVQYRALHPEVTIFSLGRVLLDTQRFLYTTNVLILAGAFLALGLFVWHWWRHKTDEFAVFANLIFFFANFGFLFLAYITGSQPDIWERYGLIFFALGLPLLAWSVTDVIGRKPSWKNLILAALLFVFGWQFLRQTMDTWGQINQARAQQQAANYLQAKWRDNPQFRAYCDDGAIRYLSGIPTENFVTSTLTAPEASAFLAKLNENAVEYFVYENMQGTVELRLFPELSYGTQHDIFHPVQHISSKFWYTDIWIYRVQTGPPVGK